MKRSVMTVAAAAIFKLRQLKAKIDALTHSARIEYPSGDVKRIFRKTQKAE